MNSLIELSIISLLFLRATKCLDSPGPFNNYYTIPFYYGARTDERNVKTVIMNDEPSLFFWSYNYNVDYRNNLWVADKQQSTIFYISKEQATWNAIFKVSGTDGVTGDRDGNIAKATFNHPSSICVYDANTTRILQSDNLKPVLLNNPPSDFCKKSITMDNYQECGVLVDESLEMVTMNHSLIKYVPFIELTKEQKNFSYSNTEPRKVYIADKMNHCIRRLDVSKAEVSTFAGICGKAGFKDGLLGQNMLTRPELVGVDAHGIIFIYDAGNNYIRMIDKDGYMHTLIQGACKEDPNTIPPKIPFQLKLRAMICYKTWIKTSGQPDSHLIGTGVTKNTECLDDHYVNCKNIQPRPLIMEKNFTVIQFNNKRDL
ncbi:UNKNOWN [Stylonychia lemnae]|uniref:Uncharacterized protein n=1 Tax=Stylonychia lemnae TaxID=5949 RepID=A0A077ZUU6_STYLE|nr:UNKNOWN [Stylonychia lemnae]|eukprot:CDW73314.1 UNKNOWN [Stylonychia lemnae]